MKKTVIISDRVRWRCPGLLCVQTAANTSLVWCFYDQLAVKFVDTSDIIYYGSSPLCHGGSLREKHVSFVCS